MQRGEALGAAIGVGMEREGGRKRARGIPPVECEPFANVRDQQPAHHGKGALDIGLGFERVTGFRDQLEIEIVALCFVDPSRDTQKSRIAGIVDRSSAHFIPTAAAASVSQADPLVATRARPLVHQERCERAVQRFIGIGKMFAPAGIGEENRS